LVKRNNRMSDKNKEELFLQRSNDPEQQERLNERARLAKEALRSGTIGKIEKVTPDLKGKWVCCISDDYPFGITLLIEDVKEQEQKVLIDAGPKNIKKWVLVDHLRLLSAISDVVNQPLENDEGIN